MIDFVGKESRWSQSETKINFSYKKGD